MADGLEQRRCEWFDVFVVEGGERVLEGFDVGGHVEGGPAVAVERVAGGAVWECWRWGGGGVGRCL